MYFKGRQGEIKHLYRSFAFLHSRLVTENAGIFVCRTRHLTLAGGSKVCCTYVLLIEIHVLKGLHYGTVCCSFTCR